MLTASEAQGDKMTERERRRRLERLSAVNGRLKHMEAEYNAIMDEIEMIWGTAASASAKAPDGMPHNPGYKDSYPAMFDRLEYLKAKRKEWFDKAFRIYKEARRAEAFIRDAVAGNKAEELMKMYFINGMSYRGIALKRNMKEATVRRQIKQGIMGIPEERLERSKSK